MDAVQISEFYWDRARKEYAAKEWLNRTIASIIKHEIAERINRPLIFEIPEGFPLPRN